MLEKYEPRYGGQQCDVTYERQKIFRGIFEKSSLPSFRIVFTVITKEGYAFFACESF